MEEVISLNEFLVWVTGVGAVIVTSWLLEYTEWFQNNSSKAKQLIFAGFASAFALSAWAIVTFVPPQVLEQIAPVFQILAGVFTSVFLGTTYHRATKGSSREGMS